MTDQTAPAPKAMWTRCKGCKDRIYNNPQDIKIHLQHCPFDLQMTIQKLTIAVFGTPDIPKAKDSLTSRVEGLEETIGDLDEQATIDPDAVAPWPDDNDDLDESATAASAHPLYADDEEDDDLYSPTTTLNPAIDRDDIYPTSTTPVA